jgi:small-conductance mechanosensitive channel
MLMASSIGVQYGVLVTRYVQGVSVRIVLGVSILLVALGTILKLLGVLLGEVATWLGTASTGVTFASIGLIIAMIVGFFIAAIRYRRGQSIPDWMVSLVSGEVQ